jgi:hypothetical protein
MIVMVEMMCGRNESILTRCTAVLTILGLSVESSPDWFVKPLPMLNDVDADLQFIVHWI